VDKRLLLGARSSGGWEFVSPGLSASRGLNPSKRFTMRLGGSTKDNKRRDFPPTANKRFPIADE